MQLHTAYWDFCPFHVTRMPYHACHNYDRIRILNRYWKYEEYILCSLAALSLNVVMSLHRDLLCCENDLTVHAPPKSTYFRRNLPLLLPPTPPARRSSLQVRACVLHWGGQILTGTNLWAERMCVCSGAYCWVCSCLARSWGRENTAVFPCTLLQFVAL